MVVKNVDQVKVLRTKHGKRVQWLLATEDGTPNFEMRYFEVVRGNPGRSESHPFEHEVFVLCGEGIVKSDTEEHRVSRGDAILILPNEPHQFINEAEEPLGFICIIPNGCEDHVKRLPEAD